MDALSHPVSSLRPTAAAPTTSAAFLPTHQTHLLKLPSTRRSVLSTTTIPAPSLSHNHPKPLHIFSSLTHHPPTTSHRRPSTGYAAALLDAARCSGVLAAVEHDVRRFSRVLRKVMVVQSVDKGEAVREAAECGGFDRRLVALVRMLVGKGRVEMVGEVLEEFGRICDELSGTKVVVVASEKRMGERELAGVAREVQRVSGAARVKVRHVFGERLPRFAA